MTLKPGNWPPSPGLAPCAILISISSQLLRYSVVTPNLAEATCLTLEFALSPFSSGYDRSIDSPPSPEQDAPPILFIAIASVSWASFDKAPWDMLPVPNLFLIDVIDSTSERSKSVSASLNSRRSLMLIGAKFPIELEYFLYIS